MTQLCDQPPGYLGKDFVKLKRVLVPACSCQFKIGLGEFRGEFNGRGGRLKSPMKVPLSSRLSRFSDQKKREEGDVLDPFIQFQFIELIQFFFVARNSLLKVQRPIC